MRLGTIAFLCGIMLFQQLPVLPEGQWLWLICISVPLILYTKPLRILAWIGAGFLLAWWQAWSLFSTTLSPDLEGRNLTVEGIVASIPHVDDRRIRFVFDITDSKTAGVGVDELPRRVRLSWYRTDHALQVGEVWRFTVRLKHPRGFTNPGSFDYERWLFRQGIRATGYVRDRQPHERVGSAPGYALTRFRQRLTEHINQVLADAPFRGVITALAVGIRSDIPESQWRTMVNTGINHLMAISGLHISLVAGLGYWLMQWGWRRSQRLTLKYPAPKAGAVAGLLCAIAYAALAGFAIPTQRALIMVGLVLASIIVQRHPSRSHTLAIALLLVLGLDPLAVLDAGFWLSFAAVAVIFYAMGYSRKNARLWRWFGLHGVISLALLPLTLLLFQRASLIAPMANLVAVPVVSMSVVPLALLGALMLLLYEPVGRWLLQMADFILQQLWPLIEWLEGVPLSVISLPVAHWGLVVVAGAGVLWLVAPRGVPARWLGLIWLAPLFWWPSQRPVENEFWFTLLDVGQGLAAVVETRDRVLLFDTGPKYGTDFNAGEAVISPFLKARGWSAIDVLIVSHGDNDHRGGLPSLLAGFPVTKLLSSIPTQLPSSAAQPCHAGQRWRWGGVVFEMLNPVMDSSMGENDRSCVLKVTAGDKALLLTGDIEKRAERELVERLGLALESTILVAPHHGSKTSSSPDFIEAVAPRYVLFPVGYRNRWGFPKASVVERYQALGAYMFDTARHGAISVVVNPKGEVSLSSYRETQRRYWHQ